VKLVYENRGEKLRLARLDLNDRIADAVAQADLDPDKEALLEKLLGKDYEVITAGDRLDKIAADFRRALRHPLGVRQEHAGLHRQDHLRPYVAENHAALADEARRGKGIHRGERRRAGGIDSRGRTRCRCQGSRLAAWPDNMDGRDHRRDRRQRGAERSRRFPEMGHRHHSPPRTA
jgi:hypothetical protein